MNAMGVEPRPFSGRAQQLTPTIPLASLGAFLKIALMGARIPLQRKLHLLGQDEPPLLKVYAETEICHRLAVVFAGLEPELQKPAAGFRVDLYLHVPRVAIECDEGGHKGYCLQGEIERERRVTAALGLRVRALRPVRPRLLRVRLDSPHHADRGHEVSPRPLPPPACAPQRRVSLVLKTFTHTNMGRVVQRETYVNDNSARIDPHYYSYQLGPSGAVVLPVGEEGPTAASAPAGQHPAGRRGGCAAGGGYGAGVAGQRPRRASTSAPPPPHRPWRRMGVWRALERP